ncbi:MAG: zinc-dependent metalloprotease [bacterium]
MFSQENKKNIKSLFFIFLSNIFIIFILFIQLIFANSYFDYKNNSNYKNQEDIKKQPFENFNMNLNIKDFLSKAKKQEGLLNVYSYNNQYFIELPKDKLNKLFYSYLAVSRGINIYPFLGGLTLPIFNYDYSVAIYFDVDKDIELKDNSNVKLYLKLKNLKYRNDSLNEWANKLLDKSYSDSLISVINAIYQNGKFYINADNLSSINLLAFSKEFSKSMIIKPFKIENISSFPKNINIKISYIVDFNKGLIYNYLNNLEGNIVELNWGIFVNDNKDYQRREYDKRVGYFATTYADVSSLKGEDGYRTIKRYINRWDLSNNKKITYYIENTFPVEYREVVKDAILEWNKAFNKIGYNNPIEVKIQDDNASWEPEDIRYTTVRYQDSSLSAFAIGPSITDPVTGEIVDADVVFYAPMLRIINSYYDLSWEVFASDSLKAQYNPFYKLYYDLFYLRKINDVNDILNELNSLIQDLNNFKNNEIYRNTCLYGLEKTQDSIIALAAIAIDNPVKYSSMRDKLVKDYIKDVVIHEVGHTLGLRHNFKASSFVNEKELLDPNYTSKNGICYSCMDYNPANLHFVNNKPYYTNDIFMTTIGYYDYLAIEYGYKQADKIELERIAKEASKYYSPDEDLITLDPNIRQFDLSSDSLNWVYQYSLINKYILDNSVYRLSKAGRSYDFIYLANSNAVKRLIMSRFENLIYYNFGKHINRSFINDVNYPPVSYIDLNQVYKVNNITLKDIVSKDLLINKNVLDNSILLGDYEWGSRSVYTKTILGNAYLIDRIYRLLSMIVLVLPNPYLTEREYYENISISKKNLYNLYYNIFKDFKADKSIDLIKKQNIEDFIYLIVLLSGYNVKQAGSASALNLSILSSSAYRDSILDIISKIEDKLDNVINDKKSLNENKLFARRLKKYLELSFKKEN